MDLFINAMIELARMAEDSPETLKAAPVSTSVGRLDETKASRQLNIASLSVDDQ
jgi:glycine dehydrogenase subunit 2